MMLKQGMPRLSAKVTKSKSMPSSKTLLPLFWMSSKIATNKMTIRIFELKCRWFDTTCT